MSGPEITLLWSIGSSVSTDACGLFCGRSGPVHFGNRFSRTCRTRSSRFPSGVCRRLPQPIWTRSTWATRTRPSCLAATGRDDPGWDDLKSARAKHKSRYNIEGGIGSLLVVRGGASNICRCTWVLNNRDRYITFGVPRAKSWFFFLNYVLTRLDLRKNSILGTNRSSHT